MTFREKLKEERPDCVSQEFEHGVAGCPKHYGLEKTDRPGCPHPLMDCRTCWDREMPDPEEQEDDINVRIWPEVVLMLAFWGLLFIIGISQMI